MGSFEEARAAIATFEQQLNQNISQLQGIGQSVTAVQQSFVGRVGSTHQEKYRDVESRSHEAKQKVAEAIQALNAAKEAATQFGASLS